MSRPGPVLRLAARAGPLLGGKAAAGAISLAYLAVAARALGPHDYGVLVLLHAYVLAVDAALNLQAWQVMVRYGGTDGADAARLVGPLGRLEFVAGAAAVCVAAALAPAAGAALGWPAEVVALAGPYSLAALANARSIAGGYLQAAGRFDLLGAHHAVSPLVRLAGAVAAAAAGWGLAGFLAAWLAAALAEWLSMWAAALLVLRRREAAVFPASPSGGSLAALARARPGIGRYMLACKADAAYVQFAPQIAPLCIGLVLGPAAAGVYAIAHRACAVIAQPAQLVAQAAFSDLVGRPAAPGGRLARLALPGLGLAAGAALLFAVPVLVFPTALAAALGGAAFAAAGALLVWLALARVLAAACPVLGAALAASGRAELSAAANFGAALAALPALPPMLRAWGPLGAGPHALLQAALCAGALLALTLRPAAATSARGLG
jgi:O-antigen/teichoic acid export membrane protein